VCRNETPSRWPGKLQGAEAKPKEVDLLDDSTLGAEIVRHAALPSPNGQSVDMVHA